MRHNWERAMLCLSCGYWCSYCNDCKCPGKGWTHYVKSSCPDFDTHAGRDRPKKEISA